MVDLLAILLSLLCSPAAADRLRLTAPDYLSPELARTHLVSAAAAGVLTGQDPSTLLAIAYHESRYTMATTPESGGRVSCGVMTPEPVSACQRSTLAGSYLAGARHLREWATAARGDMRIALTGYAGGWVLIRACAVDRGRQGCAHYAHIAARASAIRGRRPPESRAGS